MDYNKIIYKTLRNIYHKLPPKLRRYLNPLGHKIVRGLKNRNVNTSSPSVSNSSDLSWESFNRDVLSHRYDFKGIFIQEVVIDWAVPLYQRPQHIACAMGRLGYLVIYRSINWSNDNVHGFREVEKNVWLTNSEQVDYIDNCVRSYYSTASLNSPEKIQELKQNSTIIYEYIDHIDPAISGDQVNIDRLIALQEYCFKGGADYVVASAKKLESEAINNVGSQRVILAQNGVDTRHYRNTVHDDYELPHNVKEFINKHTGKIIGYFGALAPWLWYDVIEELVLARPDLGFIFIGPDYYGGSDRLVKADNLLYLGTIDYKVLPSYAKNFDICFIPFSPGEIARTTSPLKLFEYFALEKPVVVTSEMNECTIYDEVFSGDSTDTLSLRIDEALAIKDNHSFKEKMAELADKNDWDARAQAMSAVFNHLLLENL